VLIQLETGGVANNHGDYRKDDSSSKDDVDEEVEKEDEEGRDTSSRTGGKHTGSF